MIYGGSQIRSYLHIQKDINYRNHCSAFLVSSVLLLASITLLICLIFNLKMISSVFGRVKLIALCDQICELLYYMDEYQVIG